MTAKMKRREFITLLGGAAVAWPLHARAQQPAMPVIGFVRSGTLADVPHFVSAFRQGFVEGQNAAIELYSGDNNPGRLSALIVGLVRRPVAVIVGNNDAALAAKTETTTIPIVFATGGDPVRDGLVASLNRPGANVRKEVQAAAQVIGQQLVIVDVSSDRDIDAAFATFVQRQAGAVLVGTGSFFNSHRERTVALATRHALPTSHSEREGVMAGGLMSYGSNIADAYRQAGIYTGRILKGEKPADLPVVQSTKFELVLNLKTAKALGLEVPDKLLVAADEVIE
jgi:putative ABC transport system substrate-binding protein